VRQNGAFRQWLPGYRHGCDDLAEAPDPGRFARRPLLRAAVLGQRDAATLHADAYASLLRPRPAAERMVLTGTLQDVSPHVLVLQTREGEERLAMTPGTTAWRGSAVAPATLHHGDQVIVRKSAAGRAVAARVWANIGRATGTILQVRAAGPSLGTGSPRNLELLIDEGPAKARKLVVITRETYRQILVRFPRLEPGYLIDVIGLRQRGFLQAVTPATAQPAYRADHPPAPPLVSGRIPDPVSGTAVWHEPGEGHAGVLGIAYPAVDPESGCEHGPPGAPASHGPEPADSRRGDQDHADRPHGDRQQADRHSFDRHSFDGHSLDRATLDPRSVDHYSVDPHGVGPGCVRLPYLSVGSVVTVRNDCSGLSAPLPVTSCGALARLFCDRCVECRTSPRGRVADLTMAAFVELGGRLENGCFNASLTLTS
jgi:hypothetical protein